MSLMKALGRLDDICKPSIEGTDELCPTDLIISSSKKFIKEISSLELTSFIWNIYRGGDGEICFLLKNPIHNNERTIEVIFYEKREVVVFQDFNKYKQTKLDWSNILELKKFLN